jgi:hypothetical protein
LSRVVTLIDAPHSDGKRAHYRLEIEKMGTQTNEEQIALAKRKWAAVDLAIWK